MKTTSLIITTYNWESALLAVLTSVRSQTHLPDEVIIADDGSRDDTRRLIEREAATFPVRLCHSWQEDRGFRAARSRNRALAAARGDVVLLVDGDMVLHPRFVQDHLAALAPGAFLQGSRVMLTPESSAHVDGSAARMPDVFTPGVLRRRNALRLPPLSWLVRQLARRRRPHAIKSCNQAWWRRDLVAVNGFDERMEGWGREDEDLAWRAHHHGIACRQIRYAALAFHLHHRERHQDGESVNDAIFRRTLETRAVRCERGLDQHLEALRDHPLPDLRPAPSDDARRTPRTTP